MVKQPFQDDPTLIAELLRATDFEEAVNWISDSWSNVNWVETLAALADDGLVERERLLDLAFDGQLRDLRKSGSAFFRKLSQRLAPSDDELSDRSTLLIRIVAASQPSEQAAAAKALRRLAKAGHPIDGSAAAGAVLTPLTGKQKGPAMAALKLVAALDLSADERGRAAVNGLGHRHTDVQAEALDLLAETAGADGSLPAGVKADAALWVEALAPANRQRLLDLLGFDPAAIHPDEPPAAPSAEEVEQRLTGLVLDRPGFGNLAEAVAEARAGRMPPPLSFDPHVLPVPGEPLSPLRTADELVDVVIRALAGAASSVDLELIIDGLARFPSSQASRSMRSSLTASLEKDTTWYPVGPYLADAARWWTARRMPDPPPHLAPNRVRWPRRQRPEFAHDVVKPDIRDRVFGAAFDHSLSAAGSVGVLEARLWEAVATSKQQPGPTLALPSTTDGWLQVDDLLDRLASWDGRPLHRFDATQALFRLRPGPEPGPVPAERSSSAPTMGAGIRRVMGNGPSTGDAGIDRATDPVPALPRLNLIDLPKIDTWPESCILRFDIDGEVPAARRDDPIAQLLDDLVRSRTRHGGQDAYSVQGSFFVGDPVVTDWTLRALPRHRDLVLARTAMYMADDLDSNRSTDTHHVVCTALAGWPDQPLALGGHTFLALALSDRNVVTSGGGGELFAETAADGRLDAELLGRLLSELHERGFVKGARFAAALDVVVRASAVVAERVRQVLVRWVAGLEEIPRDLHAVLETLETACASSGGGIDGDRARSVLTEASSGSSKRARSAARLLALPVGDASPEAAAAGEALDRLLDRANRWATMGDAHPAGQV